MASITSTTYAKKQIPRILAEKVMAAARPLPVILPYCNQYSIEGLPTPTLRLNRYGDTGPATTGTEGTTFSTETVQSMGTEIDITPTEAAVMLMRITDGALEAAGSGYPDVLSLFQSNDVDAIVRVAEPEALAQRLSCEEKLERDLAGLFSSATNIASSNALTDQLDLEALEESILMMDILEPSHMDRVFFTSAVGVSDLRRALQVTSGGVQGVMWGNQVAPQATQAAAGQVGFIWVPIIQLSQSVMPTSGTVPGTGGHISALVTVGQGNPEQAGGSGKIGALQFCEKRRPVISTQFELRERAVDLMTVHKYGVALRAQDLIVAVLHNDVRA